VHGLVLRLRRTQRFWEMVDEEHEYKAEDQGYSNVGVRALYMLVRLCQFFLFLLFRPVDTGMPLSVAFSRVIVAALLRMWAVLIRGPLLHSNSLFGAFLRGELLRRRPLDDDAAHLGGNASARFEEAGIGGIRPLRRDVFGGSVESLLLGVDGGDLGLWVRHVVRMALEGGAVHGVDALWYYDDERRAYEHAGAQERHDAELARREGEREREDAGQKGTVKRN